LDVFRKIGILQNWIIQPTNGSKSDTSQLSYAYSQINIHKIVS